jgi:hypothetical protein
VSKQIAAVFKRSELDQAVPQHILTFLKKLLRITDGEDVIAVFGSLSTSLQIENSAVLLPDRVEYMEMGRLLPKNKSVPLSIIDQTYLLPESGYQYIVLLDKVKNSTKLLIKAPGAEAAAFYELIKEYIRKSKKGITDKKVSLICPHCGAALSGYEGEEIKCEYCDSVIIGE